MRLDAFTLSRIRKFISDFRQTKGQLPTNRDLESAGFTADIVKSAEQQKAIEAFYVTLTTGAIVKGYKLVVK